MKNTAKEVKMKPTTQSKEVNYNNIPVTLNVTLEQAVVLAQLAAKLPIESGLPLFEYLRDQVTPIMQEIQNKQANEDKNSEAVKGSAN